MSTQVGFEIDNPTALTSYIQGRHFWDEQELLEIIEDYLFWKMIERADTWEYVSEEDVFKALDA